jgi:ribonuclease-3
VLDFAVGAWLYHRFPEMDEGHLTRLRANLVRTETLAGFAQRFQLGDALLLGRGEDESGGRLRRKNLCGAFEALIGALFLDQTMEAVQVFVEPLFVPVLEEILDRESDKDAKSLFQEFSQAELGRTPSYQTASVVGPDHAREFTVNVLIGSKVVGQGRGYSKQTAAQAAARNALESMQSGRITFNE